MCIEYNLLLPVISHFNLTIETDCRVCECLRHEIIHEGCGAVSVFSGPKRCAMLRILSLWCLQLALQLPLVPGGVAGSPHLRCLYFTGTPELTILFSHLAMCNFPANGKSDLPMTLGVFCSAGASPMWMPSLKLYLFNDLSVRSSSVI